MSGKWTVGVCAAAVLALAACGDDDDAPRTDAGAGTDAGMTAEGIDTLAIAEQTQLAGLSGPVDIVRDSRGMVHIYASTLDDAIRAQGYQMARDRMGQMEFLRRNAKGTLAALAGSFAPSLIESDIRTRVMGHTRNAERIWATLAPTDPVRVALENFSAGVNAYIEEVKTGAVALPEGVREILNGDVIDLWTPVDTLALARYMSWLLSYDADADIEMSAAQAGIADAFPPGSPTPALAKRASVLHDLFPFATAENVFSRDGFPNDPTDTGTRAIRPPRQRPARGSFTPNTALLSNARAFFEAMKRDGAMPAERSDRGSNNWLVHGSKTASGAAMLSSDPHLQLTSPPLFWYCHLNTKRRGGTLDVQGLALAGTPGILLGYNENVAWGLTTAYYDVTDVYQETITPGAGGAADTVLFNGAQVAIEKVREVVHVDNGSMVEFDLEVVPHHGPIFPTITGGRVVPRTEASALSFRWTGNDVSVELRTFLELLEAENVDDARAAIEHFEVGAQNFAVATRSGDIFWSSQSRIPVRDPRAMTYDPMTGVGFTPAMVLPGTGEYEWTGNLSDRYIPHDLNPAKGYIATANNDQVGVTADGNPLNDGHFISARFANGHRIARIDAELREWTTRGDVTVDEMMALQGDPYSPMGAKLADVYANAVERAAAEASTPGTHPELAAAVGAVGGNLPKLMSMASRLRAWESHRAEAGVVGTPSATEIADSVAASIFNVATTRLVRLAFDDEIEAIGVRPSGSDISITLQFACLEPMRLRTYDATLSDTVLWDDLGTTDVAETRDDRVVRAMLAALTFLEGRFGANMDDWRWGKLHTLRLAGIPPALTRDVLSIPTPDDPMFPDGYPRHGDNWGVDASNYSTWDGTDFSYGSGPVQRLVVEMTSSGPVARNALPGGNVQDPSSPHHADEAALWFANDAPPLFFREADVVTNAETRIRFTP